MCGHVLYSKLAQSCQMPGNDACKYGDSNSCWYCLHAGQQIRLKRGRESETRTWKTSETTGGGCSPAHPHDLAETCTNDSCMGAACRRCQPKNGDSQLVSIACNETLAHVLLQKSDFEQHFLDVRNTKYKRCITRNVRSCRY